MKLCKCSVSPLYPGFSPQATSIVITSIIKAKINSILAFFIFAPPANIKIRAHYWQIASIKNIILAECHNVNMRSNVDEQNVLLRTRLVELRKEKGLSQVALAKELGVDCSTIAKYETGDRLPDLVMLCKLADYFNVTTDYLVGRTPF